MRVRGARRLPRAIEKGRRRDSDRHARSNVERARKQRKARRGRVVRHAVRLHVPEFGIVLEVESGSAPRHERRRIDRRERIVLGDRAPHSFGVRRKPAGGITEALGAKVPCAAADVTKVAQRTSVRSVRITGVRTRCAGCRSDAIAAGASPSAHYWCRAESAGRRVLRRMIAARLRRCMMQRSLRAPQRDDVCGLRHQHERVHARLTRIHADGEQWHASSDPRAGAPTSRYPSRSATRPRRAASARWSRGVRMSDHPVGATTAWRERSSWTNRSALPAARIAGRDDSMATLPRQRRLDGVGGDPLSTS